MFSAKFEVMNESTGLMHKGFICFVRSRYNFDHKIDMPDVDDIYEKIFKTAGRYDPAMIAGGIVTLRYVKYEPILDAFNILKHMN